MNEEIQKIIKSSKRTQRTEIVDGVKVVHTGRRHYIHKGILMGINGKKKNLGYELVEVLEKYDVNGNRLYSNCSSQEEAEKLVEELEKEGKKALNIAGMAQNMGSCARTADAGQGGEFWRGMRVDF